MISITDLREPVIIAPSDEKSVEKLFRSEFNDLECEYFSFSRAELYKLFSTGFFDYLNEKYGLLIADYEQEEILDKEGLKSILNDDIKKFRNSAPQDFWSNFEKCVANAIENETGLFFYF